MMTMKRKNGRLLVAYCIIFILTMMISNVAVAQTQQAVMALSPSSYTAQNLGEEFSINITAIDVQNLYSWKANVSWDPVVLNLFGKPSEGPFLQSAGTTLFDSNLPLPEGSLLNGTAEIEDTLVTFSNTGVSGSGVLATLTFTINKRSVKSPIALDDTHFQDPSSTEIDHQVQNASVTLNTGAGPVANAGGDQIVNEDTQVILNASETYTEGQNLTFTWAFTDGKQVNLNGMIATHVFDMPGVYPVNLTVTDAEGRTSSDSIKITVRDVTPPVAKITLENILPNQTIEAGQQIVFSGSSSYDPKNGTIISYSWDLVGASVQDPAELIAPTVTCEYPQAGTYVVNLTVTEDGGNINMTTFAITIRRASNPLGSTIVAILVAVTAIVLVGSPAWLVRRRKHRNRQVVRLQRSSRFATLRSGR
jgi:PKD repeat protein